tara:strand:- start:596 stop:1879 length:1284 start_codon:yes stop_codon:yes gene_type:complete
MYRALVNDAHDLKKQGRVKLWIPKLMPDVEQTKGLWSRPANNPLGGRNKSNKDIDTDQEDCYFQGTCLIPPKGSWVYVFFEDGDPNEPRYFGSCEVGQHTSGDERSVPIENQQWDEWEKKWTLFKSKQGRTIIASDDPKDTRVEITGKKRLMDTEPHGNDNSVYTVPGNQTVILLDERSGSHNSANKAGKIEKFLIRDHRNNFINFWIGEDELHVEFDKDIHVNSKKGNIYITALKDIHVDSRTEKIHINAKKDIHVKSDTEKIYVTAEKEIHVTAETESLYVTAKENIHVKSEDESIYVEAEKDIHLKSMTTDVHVSAENDMHLKTETGDMYIDAKNDIHMRCEGNYYLNNKGIYNHHSVGAMDVKSDTTIEIDGTSANLNTGAASTTDATASTSATQSIESTPAKIAIEADPQGARDQDSKNDTV